MGYIENNLIPGEQVLFKTRLHSVTIFFQAIVGASIGLIGLFCLYKSMTGQDAPDSQSKIWAIFGSILISMGVVSVIFAILKRNATEMAVTNRRILIKTGILSRRSIELLLSRVESIVITESFLGRILGYGSVVVRGTGGTPEPFDYIARPKEFRRCVQEQIEATQGQNRPAGTV
jgi:uncharacterized membrane protein YdbT with pleckstrin-like domain